MATGRILPAVAQYGLATYSYAVYVVYQIWQQAMHSLAMLKPAPPKHCTQGYGPYGAVNKPRRRVVV